jgi:hypothetical protein
VSHFYAFHGVQSDYNITMIFFFPACLRTTSLGHRH